MALPLTRLVGARTRGALIARESQTATERSGCRVHTQRVREEGLGAYGGGAVGSRDRSLTRYLWAAPATAVGLVLALIVWLSGARAGVVDGVLEVAGGRLKAILSRLPGSLRFGAITFGHVIVAVDSDELIRSRAHEQVHVGQYERWGIVFFPLYLGSSLRALLRGEQPYRDNRFEREARQKSVSD